MYVFVEFNVGSEKVYIFKENWILAKNRFKSFLIKNYFYKETEYFEQKVLNFIDNTKENERKDKYIDDEVMIFKEKNLLKFIDNELDYSLTLYKAEELI